MAIIGTQPTKHHLRRRNNSHDGVQISVSQFFLGVACLWPFILLSLLASSSPQFDPRAKIENSVARDLKLEVRSLLDRVDVMGYGPTHPRAAFIVVGEEKQQLVTTVENIFGNTDRDRIFLVIVVVEGTEQDEEWVHELQQMERGSVRHWHGVRADVNRLGGRKDSNNNHSAQEKEKEEAEDVHGRKIQVIFNPEKMGIAASRNDAAQFVRLVAEKHEKAGIKSTQEDLLLLLVQSGAAFTSKHWLTPVTGALIVPPPLLGVEDTNVAMKLSNAVSFNIQGEPSGKRTSFDASFAQITTDANVEDVLLANGISYPTPALNGAAVAMRLETFLNLPAQDNSLTDLWSANLDLALNLWLCADGIDIIKDLIISAPPSTASKPMDIEHTARFAAAWMDDLLAEKFFQAYLKIVPTVTYLGWEIMGAAAFQGDSFPKDLLQKCRSFEWYIKNINTDVTESILGPQKEHHPPVDVEAIQAGTSKEGIINNDTRHVEEKKEETAGQVNENIEEIMKEQIQKSKERTNHIEEKQPLDVANKEIPIKVESKPAVVNHIEEKQPIDVANKEIPIKVESKPEVVNQIEETQPIDHANEEIPIKLEPKPEVVNHIEEKQLIDVANKEILIDLKSKPEVVNQIEEKQPIDHANEEIPIKVESKPEVVNQIEEKQPIDVANEEIPIKVEEKPEVVNQIEEKQPIDHANEEIPIKVESKPEVVNQIEEKKPIDVANKEIPIKVESKAEVVNQIEEKKPIDVVNEEIPIIVEAKPEVVNQIEEKEPIDVVNEEIPIKSESKSDVINQDEEEQPNNVVNKETSIKSESKSKITQKIEEKQPDTISNIKTTIKAESKPEEVHLEQGGTDQSEEMKVNVTLIETSKVDESHLQNSPPDKSLDKVNLLEKLLPILPVEGKPFKPLRFVNKAIVQQAEPYDITYVDVSNGHQEHPHKGARDENFIFGYVHDEKALHKNPPKVWLEDGALEKGCAVRDGNWHMLTEKVYVDMDAAEKYAQDKSRKKDKIFCLVYTIESGHPKIPNIRQTWGKKCDGFMVASNRTESRYGTVNIPHEGPEEYNNIWQKVRSMWSYIYDNYYEEYDWFHIGGDDLFLIVDNLREYLESEEIRTAANGGIYLPTGNETKQYPLFLGRRFKYGGDEQDIFNSGGSGYTMNKATLKLLVVKGFNEIYQNLATFSEDLMVARTLRKYNVYPYDTKDDTGAERYMPFMPDNHYSYKFPPPGDKDWYAKYSIHIKEGLDHCAEKSVAFHYVKDDMMKRLFALLYHMCPEETYRH